MRRTKIVATLGPVSSSREAIEALIKAGVDVVRLNQSHGERGWHEEVFGHVRLASKRLGKAVAVMVDLQGPKMRLSEVAGGAVSLKRGMKVRLAGGDKTSDAETLYIPLKQIVKDVKAGDTVLIDDGNVALKVLSKSRGTALARVTVGGMVSSHKGINLPGVKMRIPSVTAKDLEDLRWAARMGAEYVAVSFVRAAADVTEVRKVLHVLGSGIQVIAKIEKPEALAEIDEIARLADGLMVARGDLGVEMPLEKVPVEQRRIIAAAHANDIPVIVATQMLESMTTRPRPTRAEVSDVAGAIFGGTDAVMLSGETAVGDYPVASVRQMAAIAEESEEYLERTGALRAVLAPSSVYAVADAVCHGANSAARDLSAKAVFISTTSGRTALLFSKYRFGGVLVGASDDEAAVRRMALYWGVHPVLVPTCSDHHKLLGEIVRVARGERLVDAGDTLVFLAGSPLGKTGATNLLIVHRIPPEGRRVSVGAVSGKVPGGVLTVDRKRCISCGVCVGVCPVSIYAIENGKVRFERRRLKECLGDWRCVKRCPVGAISVSGTGKGQSKR